VAEVIGLRPRWISARPEARCLTRGTVAQADNMTAETDRTRRSFVLEEAVAILARTPASLDALLRGLPDGWIVAHEGGETWSPFDVIGHLIHGERTDWVPRVKIILEDGEARALRSADDP
jgi:hypothetical protein